MPMLSEYRAAIAIESGPYVGPPLYHVRAYTGSTLSTVACHMYPVQSGLPQDDVYTDRPLYRPNATREYDKNRYILAYDPPTGVLTVDLAWQTPMITDALGSTYAFLEGFTYGELDGTTPPGYSYEEMEGVSAAGPGETFEILGPFDVPTLHQLINDGLKKTWVTVDVPCAPTQGASYHDLSLAAPWLQSADHVRQVGLLSASDNRIQTDPFSRVVRGKVVRDGGVFYFDTGSQTFNDTDVLYLRCYKQAYYHCRASGGEWGEQTGLSLENDEAPVDTEWLAAAALVLGWRRFGHLLELASNQRLIRDQQQVIVWFNDLARKHFSAVQPMLTFRESRGWGPPRMTRAG